MHKAVLRPVQSGRAGRQSPAQITAEAIRAEAEAYRGYPDGCVSNGPQTLASHK